MAPSTPTVSTRFRAKAARRLSERSPLVLSVSSSRAEAGIICRSFLLPLMSLDGRLDYADCSVCNPPCPSNTQAHRLLVAHSSSEEHTSELQSLMSISYAVFCLKTNN